eukprot:scaffold6400_cov376-Prasinococcus_capsulatus_cf.AAC.2
MACKRPRVSLVPSHQLSDVSISDQGFQAFKSVSKKVLVTEQGFLVSQLHEPASNSSQRPVVQVSTNCTRAHQPESQQVDPRSYPSRYFMRGLNELETPKLFQKVCIVSTTRRGDSLFGAWQAQRRRRTACTPPPAVRQGSRSRGRNQLHELISSGGSRYAPARIGAPPPATLVLESADAGWPRQRCSTRSAGA